MSYFQSVRTKQVITLLAIIILFIFLFISFVDFIPSFLGALVLYIVFSPVMHFLKVKKKINKSGSAILIILFSIVVILLPTIMFGDLLIVKLRNILSDETTFLSELAHINTYVNQHFNFNILSADNIALLQKTTAEIIPDLLNQTMTTFLHLGIMYFILFYMLCSWNNISDIIIKYFPYEEENAQLFATELKSQTLSNVVGAPFIALSQGLLAILGFWIFGLPEPIFWGMMCGFLSFVPVVGTAMVWLPAGIYQLSVGQTWQGAGILIYGAVIIVYMDNLIRLTFQKRFAHVHPMITIFGVILGLERFGLPGLIFGPLLISYFLIMIKVYRIEYGNKSFLDKQ